MCALVTGVQTCALPIAQRRLLSGIDEFACNARKLARSRLVFLSQGQIIARSDAERELDTDLSGEIGVRDGKTIFFRPQFGFGERHSCAPRSEEHTSELQSLMRISYAVFCLKKKKTK